VILVIFGVFLTARIYDVEMEFKGRAAPVTIGVGIAVGLFAVVSKILSTVSWTTLEPTYEPTVKGLGVLFLTKYLLPFELISLLLLFVMVGAVLLVRKETKNS
jgi:NADH:ubiquinone oxidoreductase subunit 6 (subunit J)